MLILKNFTIPHLGDQVAGQKMSKAAIKDQTERGNIDDLITNGYIEKPKPRAVKK